MGAVTTERSVADLAAKARESLRRPQVRKLLTSLAGTAAVQVLGIVTGTLLARGLGPDGRGAFAAMLLWPTIAVSIGDLGVSLSFGYYSARGHDAVPRLVGLAYRASALQSAYLVPLGVGVSAAALSVAGVGPLGAGLALSAAFIPASLLSRHIGGVLQGQLMVARFFAIRASVLAVAAVVLSGLLITSNLTVWGAVGAYIVALAGMTVLTIVFARRAARERPPARRSADANGVTPRQLVTYGLRALAGGVYPMELLSLDQMLVVFLLGSRDLGLYVSALAFTSLPRLIAYAIGMIGMPVVAAATPAGQPLIVRRYVLLSVVALTPIALALVAIAGWLVPLFFGPAFHAAIEPARYLLLGSLAFGVRKVLGDCLRGAGRPGVVSIVETASWPLLVGAAAVGTTHGLVGVTLGLLIVQIVALAALLVGAMRTPRTATVEPRRST